MTDNGLVALAERLEEYFGPSWWPGLTDVTIIAADTQIAAGKILGERGVFLPDGLITRKVLRTWQEGAARDEARVGRVGDAMTDYLAHASEHARGQCECPCSEDAEEAAATIAALNAGEAEWHRRATLADAEIATLRAAMDGLVEPLGEWLIEMMERNLTPAEATLYDALRAALATAKEAGG